MNGEQSAPETTQGETVTEDQDFKPNWRGRIDACLRKREKLIKKWQENTSYREGKPFGVEPEEDAVSIPVDWARTKNKVSQLFFQVPTVILEPQQSGLENAAPVAAAALNDVMKREVKAHVCMDEVLQDMVNASGIGAILTGIEVHTKMVMRDKYAPEQMAGPVDPLTQQPTLNPEIAAEIQANGGQMPQIEQNVPIYQCYYATRLSPARLLWPVEFTGSDWQQAAWLGYEEDLAVPVAMRKGWIDEKYIEEYGDTLKTTSDESEDSDNKNDSKKVCVQHIYYWKYLVDKAESDPRKIGHLMFVNGKKKEPVVDEDFKWQAYNEETMQWMGMTSLPVKVGTLTTLSDKAVPPSDSEVGRPQVRELMRSRSQMVKQRDRSQPLRWFDVNQVDDDIAEQMRKGVWQDMIPMNGPGNSAIGEVARANYPRDSWEFQGVIDRDLDEAWSMGRNQQGLDTPGETSAAEANIAAQNSNVRMDYERVRVLRLYLEVAESIFALMQLFQDDQGWVKLVGQDGMKSLTSWDKNTIRGDWAFDARPDSAVKVDIAQKRVESLNVYKLLRQDPLINPQALTMEVIETHGFDPTKVMAPPAPPSPPPAAARFSFMGADLANPMVVAFLQVHGGMKITKDDIAAAKALMVDSGTPIVPPTVQQLPQAGDPGQPDAPGHVVGDETPPMEPGSTEHPGPAPEVNPLNQRYEQGGNNMIEPVTPSS